MAVKMTVDAQDMERTPRADKNRLKSLLKETTFLLPNVAKLLGRLAKDSRVPRRQKVLLSAFLVYLASPIDLIPDWLPGIGHLDDWLIAALVLDRVVHAAGEDLIKEHWDGEWDILKIVRTIRAAMPAPLARRLLGLLTLGWRSTKGGAIAAWRRSALMLRRVLGA